MKSTEVKCLLGVVLAFGIGLAARAGAPLYTVTDLGTLGGDSSDAFGISKTGMVVGVSERATRTPAAFSWVDGVMSDLSPSSDSVATGVNSKGQASGYRWDLFDRPAIFENGILVEIGKGHRGQARGINENGDVVGWTIQLRNACSFVYKDAKFKIMKESCADSESVALGVNDLGDIVGFRHGVRDGSVWTTAYVYSQGVYKDLTPISEDSEAHFINNIGEVVGRSTFAGRSYTHAFVTRKGVMIDLGTLPDMNFQSSAAGINNKGQVVGSSNSVGFVKEHAFIALRNNRMKDLNDEIDPVSGAGWVLTRASAINDDGLIVGTGTHDGKTHAFLLTPILR